MELLFDAVQYKSITSFLIIKIDSKISPEGSACNPFFAHCAETS